MIQKKYIPNTLSFKDKIKQRNEIKKSKKAYKKGIYYTRKKMKSFKSKESPHILKAKKIYKINVIKPEKELAKKTKCSVKGLELIVKKGQGAYFSSGSRPSQTAHSWGIARLASAITGGKSSKVDYHLLKEYCNSNSKALKMAEKMKGGNKNLDYIKNPNFPKRNMKTNELIFKDYPNFKPNLTPEQIFRMGSFGGTYFRPIYSSVLGKNLKNQHLEFKSLGWFKNLDIDNYVISGKCNPQLNKYQKKAGSSLKDWESKGWIKPDDPYGWFQWYCRFYCGRRCSDDERQVDRWMKYASEKSGRWRINLKNKCKKANKSLKDESVSPVIRQGLQHWGFTF